MNIGLQEHFVAQTILHQIHLKVEKSQAFAFGIKNWTSGSAGVETMSFSLVSGEH